ncbi:MAG TPA: hypothetical protein VK978_02835 [Candidatus Saccharimonadales bacterium]|nr:hypothetical protein [Candidatus Saccharimonadales bacterium]
MAHALSHGHAGNRTDERDNHNNTGNNELRAEGKQRAVVDKDLQKAKFGGFHFGTAIFGWLVATGVSAILMALLTAVGSTVAVTTGETVGTVAGNTAQTVGLISGILFLLALATAYYAGGYVAGRMARFDGGRQGLGVWLIGITLTSLLGLLGAALGSQFNILQQLNLPRLPINEGTVTTAGLITLLATVVVTLLAAMAGGKKGEHYHNRIDDTGQVGVSKE